MPYLTVRQSEDALRTPNHANHVHPSPACTQCKREGVAAWQVRYAAWRDAYNAACVPRHMPRWRRGLHLVEGTSLWLSPLILGLGGWIYLLALAIAWLVDSAWTGWCQPNVPPAPAYPDLGLAPYDLPIRRVEPLDVHLARISAMWPIDRRTSAGPFPLPTASRRVHRPPQRQQAIYNAIPPVRDGLPF